MKLSLAFLVAFALFSAVLAADQNNEKDSSGKHNSCYLCIKSYIDCFNLFGIQGCTDKNAEHYTYCRECTGVDPPW
ncbi:hypothetical protein MNAN1_002791 [Malassezia nana]|uniref:Uncharacterized protein n=1 Tax=Malassezia nana TaxID=180528 RepID=A0AAF0J349_9BASI|nr:hypothetical protein MNAN1_002791 [Malassezia nana]